MSGTILCVDDDRNLCQILAKALRGEGYRVQTAFDGEEALAALEKETPDLILLDVILPRRDGFAVLETIRTFDDPLGSIPVVLMSACTWSHPGFAERARSIGAAALLEKPVPLAEVLAVVREHVGEAKRRESPRGSGKRGARRPPPALSGSLERLPFPSLLHHLHGLRASGVLHLTTGRKRKWLQLRDGYPVAVRSNLVNECLGNMLMRSGRVGREHVEESRSGMRAGRLQGEILVAMEVLSEEEMTAALRSQAEQKLFEIFSWKAGSFRFELGARVQRANSLAVKSSPANLILHGVRKRFPAERIDAYLKEHKDLFLVAGESPFYRFQEIDLEPAHEQLLRDLDGTQRLANLTGRDDTLDRTLYALLMTGLLELQSAPQGGQVARPRHVEREEASRAPQEARAELAELAERFSSQSPHEVLGIERGADEQAIREAYERLSARTHPDR
ncbi:MAG: response regulator, partial [Myxococcota bacterium]